MTPEQMKLLVAMLVPIVDGIVAATPTPIDNLAWNFIRSLLVRQNDQIATALYSEAVAKGMLPPV